MVADQCTAMNVTLSEDLHVGISLLTPKKKSILDQANGSILRLAFSQFLYSFSSHLSRETQVGSSFSASLPLNAVNLARAVCKGQVKS